MNEPGHTKVVEETTKTTYITSTSIVNEELHLVDTSSKSETTSDVKKTIVEVKGAEEPKARSRSSSSSSSSSSEDECVKNEEVTKEQVIPSNEDANDHAQIEEAVIVENNESEKEVEPIEQAVDKQEDHDSSSSSSSEDECDREDEKPKSDNELAIETVEENIISHETQKEEEELESKQEASLIQAEVKVVPEPLEVQEEKNDSSSSSSSSSDNEEEEESTKEEPTNTVEEVVIPPVEVVEEAEASNEPIVEGKLISCNFIRNTNQKIICVILSL